MKKTLFIVVVLVIASLLGFRQLAGRISLTIDPLTISLADDEGAPLGLDLDPLAIRDSIDGLSEAKIDLVTVVRMDNPNPFGFSVDTVDFTVSVRGEIVATGHAPLDATEAIEIAAGEITAIPIRAGVPLDVVFPTIADIASLAGIEYTVNGTVAVKVLVGTLSLPFSVVRVWSPTLPSLPSLSDLPGLLPF